MSRNKPSTKEDKLVEEMGKVDLHVMEVSVQVDKLDENGAEIKNLVMKMQTQLDVQGL